MATKIQSKNSEVWKEIGSLKGRTLKRYAVSSLARIAAFEKNISDKLILKQQTNNGFPMVKITIDKKSKGVFLHNVLAEMFLKKHSPKCKSVIHLNHNKLDNSLSNLKWATPSEKSEHYKTSPLVKLATERKVYTGAHSKKLDEEKVIQLKKEIWNPKRKLSLKQLADKYGIAEMNLYRIKSGVFWFHIHVEGEPIFPKYKQHLKNVEFHEKEQLKQAKEKAKREELRKKRSKEVEEKRKKREQEKKQRLEALLKRRKEKALERIVVEKRKAKRALLAEKRKQQLAKASAKKSGTKVSALRKKASIKKSTSKKAKTKK